MDDNTMSNQYEEPDQPMQSIDEIMQIIAEATIPAAGTRGLGQYITDSLDMDDDMEDLDSDPDLDVDSSGEIVFAMWLVCSGMLVPGLFFDLVRMWKNQ